MNFETALKEFVRETVTEYMGAAAPSEPELITVKLAAEICGCDESVIFSLVRESATNGFPSIRLGAKTIRIDKARLSRWFGGGGLGVKI